MTPLAQAALAYARAGLHLFPLTPASKTPPASMKGWPERASCDPKQVAAWWSKSPDANIGLLLGQEVTPGRYLTALDVDNGLCDALIASEGFCTSQTRRGWHLVALIPEPVANRRLRRDVEIKGARSYIVAPPSQVHGITYRWQEDWQQLPVKPLADLLRVAYGCSGVSWAQEHGGLPIRVGERDNRLTEVAGFIHGQGDLLLDGLPLVNRYACETPLRGADVARIATSIGGRPPDAEHADGDRQEGLWVSVADFLARMPTAVPYIWEPLLARGTLSLLAGPPKIGKSTFLTHLVRAMLQGDSFLGSPTVAPPGVFILTEEQLSLAIRLQELGLEADSRLWVNSGMPTWDEAMSSLEQVPPGSVVILDTGSRFWPLTEENAENDSAQVNAALMPLIRHTQERMLSTLFVHHMGKGAGRVNVTEANVLNFIRGSTALVGSVDVVAGLVRAPADWRKLIVQGRYGQAEITMRLTETGYERMGDAPKRQTALERAVSYLETTLRDGPVPSKDLEAGAANEGIGERTLRRAKDTLGITSEKRDNVWHYVKE